MDAEKIERTVGRLLDDYERQDGYLAKIQVERLQHKLGLDMDQCVEVYRLLDDHGVVIDDPDRDALSSEHFDLGGGDSTRIAHRSFRYSHGPGGLDVLLKHAWPRLLSAKEEVELSRRVELGRRVPDQGALDGDAIPSGRRDILQSAREARDVMVFANFRLVLHCVRTYAGMSDLSNGRLGAGGTARPATRCRQVRPETRH